VWKRALALVALLLVASLALWPLSEPSQPAVEPERMTAREPVTLRRLLQSNRVRATGLRVHVTTVGLDGEPVPGVILSLDRDEQETDLQGTAWLRSRPGHHVVVSPPHHLVGWPPQAWGPEEERWILPVEEICEGDLRILHADGEPAVDFRVTLEGIHGRTDEAGIYADASGPCEPLTLGLDDPEGQRVPWQTIRIEPLTEVRLPPKRSGELLIVDADTYEPLPVDIVKASKVDVLDELDVGHFYLESWYAVPTLKLAAPYQALRYAQVPLTGELYVLPFERDREVRVSLTCEDCPEAMVCQESPCLGSGEDWLCTCPPLRSWITADEDRIAEVGPDVTDVEVDLRPASIVGHWTGSLPCVAFASGEALTWNRSAQCHPDGSFEIDVEAGTWTVEVDWFEREMATTDWFEVGPARRSTSASCRPATT